VFVPADDGLPPFDVQLMPRRPRPGGGLRLPILIGLVVGCSAVGAMFQLRDPIVANVPALRPALPPRAAPAPIARRAPAAVPDDRQAEELGRRIFSVSLCVLLVVPPTVLPAVYSRRRVLSVGRWLIMAGLCLFLCFVGGVCVEVGALGRARGDEDFDGLGLFGGLLSLVAFLGIGGCLLAAAIYPKDPPRP
jgi:hypothetical protein